MTDKEDRDLLKSPLRSVRENFMGGVFFACAFLSVITTVGIVIVLLAEAVGFFSKEEAPETLIDGIRRAARGEVFFSQEQLTRANQWRKEVWEPWESLTERERQVLQLLAKGQDNATIAQVLAVTPKTKEYHVLHQRDRRRP